MVDPAGGKRQYVYDDGDRTLAVTSPGGDTVSFGYDAEGGLTEIGLPSGGVTQYQRDAQGRMVSVVHPDGAIFAHEYDASGNLIRTTDPAGRELKFAYDASGRLAGKSLPEGNIVYRYAADGTLVEANDGNFPVQRTLDAKGRIAAVSWPSLSRSLGFAYDDLNRVSQLTGSAGQQVGYKYDAQSRMTAIVLPGGAQIALAYDSGGRMAQVRFPNGVAGAYRYAPTGGIAQLAWSGRGGSALATFTYHYDPRGDVVAIDRGATSTQYKYDADGRLTEERAGTRVVQYEYGPGGDRSKVTRGDSGVSYDYSGDQLAAAGNETFKYDASGNITERDGSDGPAEYRFDSEGRLTGAATSQGALLSFAYDAMGNRVARADEHGETYFLQWAGQLIEELGPDGASAALYVYGPGIDRPLAMLRDGKTYFYLADGQGNVALLTDGDGKVAASYETDAFGQLLGPLPALANPFIFAGREYESALGLYFNRARYYDPALGRFLSPDPLIGRRNNVGSYNRYAYALNAPTRYQDPSGLDNTIKIKTGLPSSDTGSTKGYYGEGGRNRPPPDYRLDSEGMERNFGVSKADQQAMVDYVKGRLQSDPDYVEGGAAAEALKDTRYYYNNGVPGSGDQMEGDAHYLVERGIVGNGQASSVQQIWERLKGTQDPPGWHSGGRQADEDDVDDLEDPLDVAESSGASAAGAEPGPAPGRATGGPGVPKIGGQTPPGYVPPDTIVPSPDSAPSVLPPADSGGGPGTPGQQPGTPAPGQQAGQPGTPGQQPGTPAPGQQAGQSGTPGQQPGTPGPGQQAGQPGTPGQQPGTPGPGQQAGTPGAGPEAGAPPAPGTPSGEPVAQGPAAPAGAPPGEGTGPIAESPGAAPARCTAGAAGAEAALLKGAGVIGNVMTAVTAAQSGVEAAQVAAQRGYKLNTVQGQLLADGLALRKAYWNVFAEPIASTYRIANKATTDALNKAFDDLHRAIEKGDDPGAIGIAYANLKGFTAGLMAGMDNIVHLSSIGELCNETLKGGPLDWIKQKITTGDESPTFNNAVKAWRACRLQEAYALAQLAQSTHPDPGLNALLPKLQAAAQAEANVQSILQQLMTTADPTQMQALLDQAAAAAKSVKCLSDRVGKLKPAAPPQTKAPQATAPQANACPPQPQPPVPCQPGVNGGLDPITGAPLGIGACGMTPIGMTPAAAAAAQADAEKRQAAKYAADLAAWKASCHAGAPALHDVQLPTIHPLLLASLQPPEYGASSPVNLPPEYGAATPNAPEQHPEPTAGPQVASPTPSPGPTFNGGVAPEPGPTFNGGEGPGPSHEPAPPIPGVASPIHPPAPSTPGPVVTNKPIVDTSPVVHPPVQPPVQPPIQPRGGTASTYGATCVNGSMIGSDGRNLGPCDSGSPQSAPPVKPNEPPPPVKPLSPPTIATQPKAQPSPTRIARAEPKSAPPLPPPVITAPPKLQPGQTVATAEPKRLPSPTIATEPKPLPAPAAVAPPKPANANNPPPLPPQVAKVGPPSEPPPPPLPQQVAKVDAPSVQPECRKEGQVYHPDQNDWHPIKVTIIGGAECPHTYAPLPGSNMQLTSASMVGPPPRQGKVERGGPLTLTYRPRPDANGSDQYDVEVCGTSPHGSGCSRLTYQITFQ